MKRTLALLTCLLALVPVASAAAEAPPKGTYACRYIGSHRLFGLLTFYDARSYAFNKKRKGTYGTSARTIRFKSGPMKGAYRHAVWRRSGKAVYVNLFDGSRFGRHDTDSRCLRRRS